MSKKKPWTPTDVQRVLVNPIYAINIAPPLLLEHDTLLSEGQWVSANARLIRSVGPEKYLRLLLDVLKGNYACAGGDA